MSSETLNSPSAFSQAKDLKQNFIHDTYFINL